MATAMKGRKARADLPEGGDNPLNAAIAGRDRQILEMVEAAIRHRNCMLAFQPVMSVHGLREPAFYEGLIRVLDATGRVIPAREFMPVVEDTELGRELDCNALEIGLRTLARNPALRLSINMSARSIGYRRWQRILDRCLGRDDSLGERLILEISEKSAMTVPELVIDFMDRQRGRGIAFALDDFGSGPVAVRHFRDFVFDAVKIDGQFVRGISGKPENRTLVQALADIARRFEMLTIAESVETATDADVLVNAGIDCLQGYLFGAPTVRAPWKAEAKAIA